MDNRNAPPRPPQLPVVTSEITEQLAILDRLTKEYKELSDKAVQASRLETDALNAMNRAQCSLDDLMNRYRDEAPRGSDWKREQR